MPLRFDFGQHDRSAQFIQQFGHATPAKLRFEATKDLRLLAAIHDFSEANSVLGGRKIHLSPWFDAKTIAEFLGDGDLPNNQRRALAVSKSQDDIMRGRGRRLPLLPDAAATAILLPAS